MSDLLEDSDVATPMAPPEPEESEDSNSSSTEESSEGSDLDVMEEACERGREVHPRVITSSWHMQLVYAARKGECPWISRIPQHHQQRLKAVGWTGKCYLRLDGLVESFGEKLCFPTCGRDEKGPAIVAYAMPLFQERFLPLWIKSPTAIQSWINYVRRNERGVNATHAEVRTLECPVKHGPDRLKWLCQIFAEQQYGGGGRCEWGYRRVTHCSMTVGDIIIIGELVYLAAFDGFWVVNVYNNDSEKGCLNQCIRMEETFGIEIVDVIKEKKTWNKSFGTTIDAVKEAQRREVMYAVAKARAAAKAKAAKGQGKGPIIPSFPSFPSAAAFSSDAAASTSAPDLSDLVEAHIASVPLGPQDEAQGSGHRGKGKMWQILGLDALLGPMPDPESSEEEEVQVTSLPVEEGEAGEKGKGKGKKKNRRKTGKAKGKGNQGKGGQGEMSGLAEMSGTLATNLTLAAHLDQAGAKGGKSGKGGKRGKGGYGGKSGKGGYSVKGGKGGKNSGTGAPWDQDAREIQLVVDGDAKGGRKGQHEKGFPKGKGKGKGKKGNKGSPNSSFNMAGKGTKGGKGATGGKGAWEKDYGKAQGKGKKGKKGSAKGDQYGGCPAPAQYDTRKGGKDGKGKSKGKKGGK